MIRRAICGDVVLALTQLLRTRVFATRCDSILPRFIYFLPRLCIGDIWLVRIHLW